VREQHGKDSDLPPERRPMRWPSCATLGGAEVVTICARHQTPAIAYGTGTSLEGHITAPYGGITVDLSQMNNILSVNAYGP
jgi:D-lactate dehydrogenase (cytochrome)